MMSKVLAAPPPLLLSYQQRWATDRARMKIGMFARQTGKTFTTSFEIVDRNVDAAAITAITGLYLTAFYKDAGNANHYSRAHNPGEASPIANYPSFTRGKLRTQPLLLPADAASVWIEVGLNVPAGCTGTIKLYNPVLRIAT